MRRSSVGSSMAALIARPLLVCRDAVGNSMKESINACVNIDLHFLELQQLVGREYGADVVRDMGALHGEVGLQRGDFRGLRADGGLIDSLHADGITQGAPFGQDFFDEWPDGWLVFAEDGLHFRFLVGGHAEPREFPRKAAFAETDVVSGVRVREESEEAADGQDHDGARCDQYFRVCLYFVVPLSPVQDAARAGKVTTAGRLFGKEFGEFPVRIVYPDACWMP